MHSFVMMNVASHQIQQSSQASLAAPHPSQGASRAWPANATQQYMTGNTGEQLSQSANLALQKVKTSHRQPANWRSSNTSHLKAQSNKALNVKNPLCLQLLLGQTQYATRQLQNENIPVRTTCVSQSPPMQTSYQNVANQSLRGTTVSNANYAQQNTSGPCRQSVSFNGVQTNRNMVASHPQQNWSQQAVHPAANGVIPSYTAAPPIPYDQKSNANATRPAPLQNGQTLLLPCQIQRQNFSHVGYSQSYPSSSQSFSNNSIAAQCSSSNGQTVYTSNGGLINQQPSGQGSPLYNNSFRNINSFSQYEKNNFLMKTNELALNNDPPLQQMPRQNVHTNSIRNPITGSSNSPPSYKSHQFNTVLQLSNQNIQTASIAHLKRYSLHTGHSLPPHSGQPSPQCVMPRAQQTVNASFQQSLLPNTMSVSTSRSGGVGGQVVPTNEKVIETSVASISNVSQASNGVLLQGGELQAVVISQSNKNVGMHSQFKQNDCYCGIRAVAVVPPLSQEEQHSPVFVEPCKSVDDAEKRCISPDVTASTEAAPVIEAYDQNPVTSNNEVLTNSDSEPNGLAQTSQQDNHEPVIQDSSEGPVSQSSSEEPFEGAVAQSPPTHELSLLPTKSWTTEHLTKLIFKMDKIQPKPKDTSDESTIVKLVITMWNKNVHAVIKSYKQFSNNGFYSDIEKFCDTYIKQDTHILTQVSPDFKDQLKRYIVLNEEDVYSEPPYKSLWLNVNDQLDDIDKEFGFPWPLKRHLYVDQSESLRHDLETFENTSEQAANETVSQVSPLSEPEPVDMTEESEAPQNLPVPASPQELAQDACEANFFFKIEVLPPGEAKVIFEQGKPNPEHDSKCEKEISVCDSEQTEGSDDVVCILSDHQQKKSSENQLEEICCLARFIEMHSGLGKPSTECQCRDERNANKGTYKTLKPEPERLSIGQNDVECQTAILNPPKIFSNLSQIIDLTDDQDDQLLSLFDNKLKPISHICSQPNAVPVNDHEDGERSHGFSSPEELHNLVLKEKESKGEHVQVELSPTGSLRSSDLVSCIQQDKLDPSNSTGMEEPVLFIQKENYEQAPATSNNKAGSPSEANNQTEVSDVANQTSLSLNVDDEGSGKKVKRQSSIDHDFLSLNKPKKCKLQVSTDSDHTSKEQHSASEGKVAELMLFGSGQQEKSLHQRILFYERQRPPGVLTVKLDSFGTDNPTHNHSKQHSVKQLIYENWRKSFPTMSSSVAFRRKNKLKRQTILSALVSCRNSRDETQTTSPKCADRTKKYILSLKKRKAFAESRRHEEMKRRRYSVAFERPKHRQESETSNDMPANEGIVLKFSVLPNTFDLMDGSARKKEAAEPTSDKLEPVKEKELIEKAATKPKGTWYQSQAKHYEPLHVSKNASLFHEYKKKYKEKTHTSMDE